jgi:hypothetical protein
MAVSGYVRLSVDVPQEVHTALKAASAYQHKPIKVLVRELLTRELPHWQTADEEEARRALRSLIGLARSGNPHNADNEALDATLAAVYAKEAVP